MTQKEIKMWQARIQSAEDLQSKVAEARKQTIKLYTGTFFGNPYRENELTEVNFVYEFMEVLVSSIYARNPYIFVRSYSGRWAAFAETMETVINYYWKEKLAKKKIIQCIKDSALQPPGFVEIGYTLLSEKNKIITEIESDYPELKEVRNRKEKVESEQGVLDETIKEDDVFLNYVSSWDILWPDGYHDIRLECPYIIKRQKISYLDLIANPIYKPSKYKLKGLRQTQIERRPTVFNMKAWVSTNDDFDADLEQLNIILYHVFDKRGHKRFILAKNFLEDTLFEGEWNYFIDGFTFYPLIFNEVPRVDEEANSYPMSDIAPMIPQLKELSYISSAMNKHRKRAGTLLVGKKGSITETDATKIQNASDVDLILLESLSEQDLRGFTPPALPQDFYTLREVYLQDLMRISGYNQLLGNARGIETATESENVRIGSQMRQSKKVDTIEDFTVEVSKGLAGLIWQFIQDKKRIEEIIGEEVTEEMWPSLPRNSDGSVNEAEARRMIQRDLHFKIDAGSTQPPKDVAIERRQWENLAGVIRANFPNRIKEDVFLKQLLKKYDAHDIDNMVIGFDDEEIVTAQEENKLLLKGIPQIVGPNENDMLHLKVHSQAYQVTGLNITREMDEHILKHNENMLRKNPALVPQKGDSKIAPKTTTPNINRKGVPDYVDIASGAKGVKDMGQNKGGGITK